MILKIIHVTFAILTIVSFTLRGIWMLQGSPVLNNKLVKVAPHIIDTVLFFSGVVLVIQFYSDIFSHGWLILKLAAVLIYILFGSIALKYGSRKKIRGIFLCLSWILLGFIVYLASSNAVLYFKLLRF